MAGLAPIVLPLVAFVLAAVPVPPPATPHRPVPGASQANLAPSLTLPRAAMSALRSLGGRIAGREVRIVLVADTLFEPGQARLRADGTEVLERVAIVARALPDATVAVVAHCDGGGSESAMVALTVRQGRAVADWLQARGRIGQRWLAVRALGASQPIAAETRADGAPDLAGRRRNRRVEVLLRQR